MKESLYVDVDQYWLADAFNLGYNAFEIKCLGQDDFEDFLDVDRS